MVIVSSSTGMMVGSAGMSPLPLDLHGKTFADENEERQALLDYAGQHGLELDERRAGRAVAAGRGDELWARLRQRAGPTSPPTR